MGFDPEPELSPEEVTERVDTVIEEEEVVLFMKGTPLMPQCGFSRRALGLIGQYRDDVATVNGVEAKIRQSSLQEGRRARDLGTRGQIR